MTWTLYDTVNEGSCSYITKFLATLFEDKNFPCNDTDIVWHCERWVLVVI